jgi:hypothetical protein
MSLLNDEALDRLAMLLSRGSPSHAEEIARLVRIELCDDLQKTPVADPLFGLLNGSKWSWAGRYSRTGNGTLN